MESLKSHWPEYLMEGALLGLFMVSACGFGTLLEAPRSPVREAIDNPDARRALMGLAMGLTAVILIYSPWGKRSGAHMNPAVTLTFLRLGKVAPVDAAFYMAAQTAGGLAGVVLSSALLGAPLALPPVQYVVTVPGAAGAGAAFFAETALTFVLMSAILVVSNRVRWMRWTGVMAGALIALFIALEAPISGMSLNPARSLASAWPAQYWPGLWIYFAAPPLGMLIAAEAYLRAPGANGVLCAKLCHPNGWRCIFCERHRS